VHTLTLPKLFRLPAMFTEPDQRDHGDMPLTAVLVDDSRPFLESATALLEQEGVRVVGTASTAEEAVLCVRRTRPDVVLVDVHLGETSGFDVPRLLVEDGSTAPVIMVSTFSREDVEPLLGDTRAIGFVPKAELTASAVEGILADGHRPDAPRMI
jgi:DNA-binding NarL/FixJ family response regulator